MDLIEIRVTERLRTDLLAQQAAQDALASQLTQVIERMDSRDGVSMGSSTPPGLFASESPMQQPEWLWIEPMESLFGSGNAIAAPLTDAPQFTIPVNATLVNSTTMTALVGRVPVDGRVTDPLPFKVVTGADNLAANGLTIEGLEGSIWSGFVVGDWALACVTGTLTSVTFVFQDGRIRTLGENRYGGERIGWDF